MRLIERLNFLPKNKYFKNTFSEKIKYKKNFPHTWDCVKK
uniref:Uncharacterized protein n=1 Tax=viral metagenome TaxID=1070528 RepID=A0A6C0D089_9ZZZZ